MFWPVYRFLSLIRYIVYLFVNIFP